MTDTTFKKWLEQTWKRDMGMPNQLDNPVLDKQSDSIDYNKNNEKNNVNNSNFEASDNIQALGNHLRALNRLVARISSTDKFFGMERELDAVFKEFRHKMEKLLSEAESRNTNQPQVGADSQGVPLNQQINPEKAEKLKDEQPPRMDDPSIGGK